MNTSLFTFSIFLSVLVIFLIIFYLFPFLLPNNEYSNENGGGNYDKDISNIKKNVISIENDIFVLKEVSDDFDQSIKTLQTTSSQVNNIIENNSTSIKTLNNTVNTLTPIVNKNKETIDKLALEINNNTTDFSDIQKNIKTLEDKTSEHSTKISNLEIQQIKDETRFDTFEKQLNNLDSQINDFDHNNESILSDIKENKENISGLKNKTSNLETSADNIKKDVSTLNSKTDILETSIDTVKKDIFDNTTDIQENTTAITTLKEFKTQTNTTIDNMKNDISLNSTKLARIVENDNIIRMIVVNEPSRQIVTSLGLMSGTIFDFFSNIGLFNRKYFSIFLLKNIFINNYTTSSEITENEIVQQLQYANSSNNGYSVYRSILPQQLSTEKTKVHVLHLELNSSTVVIKTSSKKILPYGKGSVLFSIAHLFKTNIPGYCYAIWFVNLYPNIITDFSASLSERTNVVTFINSQINDLSQKYQFVDHLIICPDKKNTLYTDFFVFADITNFNIEFNNNFCWLKGTQTILSTQFLDVATKQLINSDSLTMQNILEHGIIETFINFKMCSV